MNSICQEAGMLAVRDNRYMVTGKGKNSWIGASRTYYSRCTLDWYRIKHIILDFEKAYANQVKNNDEMEFEYYH